MSSESHTVELSVIIPNYNNGQYLDDCIQSVIDQTYKNYEVIIADDHSSDHSVDIINEWIKTNPGIRLLQRKKNIGVSKNRHEAIMQAKGKYITTLDSDDVYLDPRKLESEMELIIHHEKVSGTDVCAFSNVVIVDKDLNFVGYQWSKEKIKVGDIFNDMITRRSMIPRDFIFLKSDYKEVGGYDPQFNLYEDWDLKIRLAKRRAFYFTGIKGIGYRRKGDGLSYVPLNKHIVALKKIFKKNQSLIRDEDLSNIKGEFDEQINALQRKFILNLEEIRGDYKNKGKLFDAFLQGIKIEYYKIFK